MFSVQIDALRSVVKSVLPLVGEGHKGNGTGVFVEIDHAIWCISGSFQTKLGGARLCELDDGYESIINKFINLRELHKFLSVSLNGERVKISSTTASLKFSVGVDSTTLRYQEDYSFCKFIKMPSESDAVVIENYSSVLSVCNAAVSGSMQMNPKLSGVYISIGERVEMVAVDGYIMGYSSIENNSHPPIDALAPADFMTYALRLYWDTSPMLRIVDGKAWLFNYSFFVFSPLMADQDSYPGKQMIEELKVRPDNSATVDTVMILDRLNAFATVDYRGKNEIYTISAVSFTFDDEKDMLVLSGKSADGDVESADLHIPFSGDPNSWIINMNSVKKIGLIFKNLLSAPNIVFSLHRNEMWMLVRPSNNDNIVFGIVPMRF
jgi:hypothetical protein